MKKFKVYYERRECEYIIIEARSAEEAEELADINYSDYNWNDCDGTMEGEILIGATEELKDE